MSTPQIIGTDANGNPVYSLGITTASKETPFEPLNTQGVPTGTGPVSPADSSTPTANIASLTPYGSGLVPTAPSTTPLPAQPQSMGQGGGSAIPTGAAQPSSSPNAFDPNAPGASDTAQSADANTQALGPIAEPPIPTVPTVVLAGAADPTQSPALADTTQTDAGAVQTTSNVDLMPNVTASDIAALQSDIVNSATQAQSNLLTRPANNNIVTAIPDLADINITNAVTRLEDSTSYFQTLPSVTTYEVAAAVQYRNAFKGGSPFTDLVNFYNSLAQNYFVGAPGGGFAVDSIWYWIKKYMQLPEISDFASLGSSAAAYYVNTSIQAQPTVKSAVGKYKVNLNSFFSCVSDSIGLLANSKYHQLDSTQPIFDIAQQLYGVPIPFSANMENKIGPTARNLIYNLSKFNTAIYRRNLMGIAYYNPTYNENLKVSSQVPHSLNLVNDIAFFVKFANKGAVGARTAALGSVITAYSGKLLQFIKFISNIGNKCAMNLRDIYPPINGYDQDFTVHPGSTEINAGNLNTAAINQQVSLVNQAAIADAKISNALYASTQAAFSPGGALALQGGVSRIVIPTGSALTTALTIPSGKTGSAGTLPQGTNPVTALSSGYDAQGRPVIVVDPLNNMKPPVSTDPATALAYYIGNAETGFSNAPANVNGQFGTSNGLDTGYYQVTYNQVYEDMVNHGASSDYAKQVATVLTNGGSPGQPGTGGYTFEQQTQAMTTLLNTAFPNAVNAAANGNQQTAIDILKGQWPSLPGGKSDRGIGPTGQAYLDAIYNNDGTSSVPSANNPAAGTSTSAPQQQGGSSSSSSSAPAAAGSLLPIYAAGDSTAQQFNAANNIGYNGSYTDSSGRTIDYTTINGQYIALQNQGSSWINNNIVNQLPANSGDGIQPVLLFSGANDGSSGITAGQIYSSLSTLEQQKNIDAYVVAPGPGTGAADNVINAVSKYNQSTDSSVSVITVPIVNAGPNQPYGTYYISDGTHYTSAGLNYIKQQVAQVVGGTATVPAQPASSSVLNNATSFNTAENNAFPAVTKPSASTLYPGTGFGPLANGAAAVPNVSSQPYSNKQRVVPFAFNIRTEDINGRASYINVDYLLKKIVNNNWDLNKAMINLVSNAAASKLSIAPAQKQQSQTPKTFTLALQKAGKLLPSINSSNLLASNFTNIISNLGGSNIANNSYVQAAAQQFQSIATQNALTTSTLTSGLGALAGLAASRIPTNILGAVNSSTSLFNSVASNIGLGGISTGSLLNAINPLNDLDINISGVIPSVGLGSLGDIAQLAGTVATTGSRLSISSLNTIQDIAKQINSIICNFHLPSFTWPLIDALYHTKWNVTDLPGKLWNSIQKFFTDLAAKFKPEELLKTLIKQIENEIQAYWAKIWNEILTCNAVNRQLKNNKPQKAVPNLFGK